MGKQEILAGAITDMAAVLGSEAAAEAGHYFNCGEADAIAIVMALGGHKREAATWLLAHAEGEMEGTGDGDDRGDRHWVAMQVGLDAALAYVDGLTGTACSVSALGAQLDAASVETEQEIRELFPRTAAALDGVAVGIFESDVVNVHLLGALGFSDAEDALCGVTDD